MNEGGKKKFSSLCVFRKLAISADLMHGRLSTKADFILPPNIYFFISFSGVILKVRNDGILMPKLKHSMCISAVTDKLQQGDEDFVYILPRNDDMLWLGGLVQPNQWERSLTLDYAPIRRMFDKIKEFYPPLRSYGDDDVEEVLVGLRPARRGDICLEWDPICSSVLHNYGHGGSGVTLSWGCASEVCALIDHALKRRKLIYVSRL